MNDLAYDYLQQDRLHHIDMLETLNRGIGEVLYADREGVLLHNVTGNTYMISTENEKTLEAMLDKLENPELIEMHQLRFVPKILERFGLRHSMECIQFAYISKEPMDERTEEGVELRELTISELDSVMKNYEHLSDERYISERIWAGMIGAYIDGKLAGFIGTHAEGTLGILQVLPQYRRRGIARSLEAALINRQLRQGLVPHAHVIKTNEASIKLQKKLGMSFSDKSLVWLYNE